jgi:hypothetical protein
MHLKSSIIIVYDYSQLLALKADNMRQILNITGFRKSVKKFDKVTGVGIVIQLGHIDHSEAMNLVSGTRYIHERKRQSRLTFREVIDRLLSQVDPCAFTSDDLVQVLLKEMEDLFTARFGETTFEDNLAVIFLLMSHAARGDRKHALVHLRAVPSHKTQHSSTFRAGLALGLGFSALIDGILLCKFMFWNVRLLKPFRLPATNAICYTIVGNPSVYLWDFPGSHSFCSPCGHKYLYLEGYEDQLRFHLR